MNARHFLSAALAFILFLIIGCAPKQASIESVVPAAAPVQNSLLDQYQPLELNGEQCYSIWSVQWHAPIEGATLFVTFFPQDEMYNFQRVELRVQDGELHQKCLDHIWWHHDSLSFDVAMHYEPEGSVYGDDRSIYSSLRLEEKVPWFTDQAFHFDSVTTYPFVQAAEHGPSGEWRQEQVALPFTIRIQTAEPKPR